jgi:hypothetical protein
MSNDSGLTPQEQELAAALGNLAPTQASLSRDHVMFAAGRASIRRRNLIWQGISSGLVVLLLVSVFSRPEPVTIEPRQEIAATNTVDILPATLTVVDDDNRQAFRQYVRTRRAVLERGLDVLPTSRSTRMPMGEPPLTREDLSDLLSST